MRRAFAALLLFTLPVAALAQASLPVGATAPDPNRLVAARRIAAMALPEGSVRTVMGATLDALQKQMTNGLMDQVLAAVMQSMPEVDRNRITPAAMRDVIAILDPAFDERQRRTMVTMFRDLTEVMAPMEPAMREGMATAYARRFTVAQLSEIERFFATPVGADFARSIMTIGTDPAMLEATQAMMPRVLEAMPALVQKARAATADLPKPRDPKDLTPSQKAELERLIGLPAGARATPAPKT